MKNILFLICMFLSFNVIAQDVSSFPFMGTTRKKLVAQETTYQRLSGAIRIVSTNPTIAVGLLSSLDSGIYRYVVEKKYDKKTKYKYLEYTIYLQPEYRYCVRDYFTRINH